MTPLPPLRMAQAHEWPGEPFELVNATAAMHSLPKEATGLFWRVGHPNIRHLTLPPSHYLMICRGRQPLIAQHWRQIDHAKAEAWNEALLAMRMRLHGPINGGRTPCEGVLLRRACVIALRAKPAESLLYFSPDATGHDRVEELQQLDRDHPGLFIL